MIGALIALVLGLIAGGVVGFVLGAEGSIRCENCLSAGGDRYREGHQDGWRAGAETMKETVEVRGLDMKGVWHISRKELDEALEDVVDIGNI